MFCRAVWFVRPSDCRKIKRPSENHTAFCCRTTANNAIGRHYIAALTIFAARAFRRPPVLIGRIKRRFSRTL
ncbi:hypothetical protein NEIELOOT_00517 [Neisseria elongata subsp. glycolytica ATCC 29315]|uniref:Uncharacterized protein n=1 Tax=Neisseria elongata subsp. glycolytica ATCC 29315 TaxID=546263 RepID=D4DN89_NEIEG|nr:hypothetical protein NEIELOOT_00517 [Neisseria elongata subsp. glycolytica ATCC 29315]